MGARRRLHGEERQPVRRRLRPRWMFHVKHWPRALVVRRGQPRSIRWLRDVPGVVARAVPARPREAVHVVARVAVARRGSPLEQHRCRQTLRCEPRVNQARLLGRGAPMFHVKHLCLRTVFYPSRGRPSLSCRLHSSHRILGSHVRSSMRRRSRSYPRRFVRSGCSSPSWSGARRRMLVPVHPQRPLPTAFSTDRRPQRVTHGLAVPSVRRLARLLVRWLRSITSSSWVSAVCGQPRRQAWRPSRR